MNRPLLRRRVRRGFRLAAWGAALLIVVLAALDRDDPSAQPVLPRATPPPRQVTSFVLGRSSHRRRIRAWRIIGRGRGPTVLVVGEVHGDETAGTAVTRLLITGRPPARGTLWVVPELNPDGAARHTRQNGHGVDLNRNFPYRWRRLDHPGGQQYSGPRPLSEPESRIAAALVRRIRPTFSVWLHQPIGVVDLSGGDKRVELRFARDARLPPKQLTRYPGSAVGWENHLLPGHTAFVVELPAGRARPRAARRWARAIRGLLRSPPGRYSPRPVHK